MKTAVLYLRMSTDKQDKSIEQQREELRAAFGEKYEIVDEYKDEGISGSKRRVKRRGFQQLLADAEKGKFEVVLCWSLSRFSRLDTIEGAAAKRILRDNNIRLHTILEGELDWNSTTGRIVDAVLTESQHEYSVTLARQVLRGKLGAARKGKLFGQLTPYGLARLVIDPQGNKRVVERTERFQKPKDWTQKFIPGDPKEVETVRWLFEEFHRRDVSFHQLARELNQKGIPSPSGGKWIYQTIKEILSNVRYAGDLSIGRDGAGEFYRLEGDEIVRNTNPRMETHRDSALVFPGTHDELVSRDVFNDVQVKVKRRWRSGKHSNGAEGFALTGVLYCGNCGKPLYGNDGSRRAKGRPGVRYSCKGEHRRPSDGCGQWGIHEEEILPYLLKTLVEQIERKVLVDAESVPQMTAADDMKPAEKRLAKLRAEYDAGLQRFLKLSPDLKELAGDMAEQLKRWKSEIGALEEEIRCRQAMQSDPWREVLRQRNEWLVDARDKLVFLETAGVRVENRRYSAGAHLPRSSVRELLHRIECRVELWWERSSAHRYRLVRGRVIVAGTAQFDGSASLMVWCGLRNGRVASSGWPGLSRPSTL